MSEFGKLDLEDMQFEEERLKSSGASNFLDQFVPMPEVKPGQTGTVVVRLLPPVQGGKLFQYNRVHTMNGRKIHCPKPLVNGKWAREVACPICDYYSSLWKQIDKLEKAGQMAEAEALKDEAREIKPVERYYYNAIVRSMVDSEGKTVTNCGPRILSIGKMLHRKIIQSIVGDPNDPDSRLGNVTDPQNGYDFIIRKEATPGDGYPKYERSDFGRSSVPLGNPDEIAKWVESLHDLTTLRNPKGVDVLERELAIHRGLIADEDESFNVDKFDAKYAQEKTEKAEKVQEILNHKPGSVSVPEGVPESKPAKAATAVAASTASAAVSEDLPIEDEAFLKELEEMNG